MAIDCLLDCRASLLSVPTAATTHSLHGILSQGRTTMSSRLLRDWIRQPLTDLQQLQRRQDYIDAIMADQDLRSHLDQDLLKKLPDIDKLIDKFDKWSQRKADRVTDAPSHIKMLVQVHHMLLIMPRIVNALQSYSGAHASLVHADLEVLLSSILPSVDLCRQLVEDSVDMRAAARHDFRMNSEKDEELKIIDQKIRRITKDMDDERSNVADQYSLEDAKVS